MAVITSPLKTYFSLNSQPIVLTHYEGGIISGEIIKDKDPNQAERKHLGGITYEDFVFETKVNAQVKDMIRNSWEGDRLLLTCSLLATDSTLKATSETVFVDPSLIETVIPKCDATSKESAVIQLRIKPALINIQKGDGKVIQPIFIKEKAFLRANFKFELGNLPCFRVSTIDSISVKKNRSGNPPKHPIAAGKPNQPLDIENLFLSISIADYAPWLEWHKTFVVEGRNSPSDELSGRLVFLGPNMRDELLAFKLSGVGIFRMERKMLEANQVARFSVGLYCNHIEIEP